MGTKGFVIFFLALFFQSASAAPLDSIRSPREVRYPAPDSLIVRFYGKIFLLPSEDAPLMGIAEDAAKLCVFRRKGTWAQVGFKGGTGWMLDADGAERSAQNAPVTAVGPAGRIAQVSFFICMALGFTLLLVALALRARRNRGKKPNWGNAAVPDGKPAPQAKADPTEQHCLLEGKVAGNGLSEILQFLESGRRTGMLSVENGHPAGVINFTDGMITFAQTKFYEGPDAVLEILSLPAGSFQFFGDKRIRQVNCRLSAFEILLQSAHRLDETGKFAFLKGD